MRREAPRSLARALYPRPPLLVAVNPTRGLDVGAESFVRQQIGEQRARGGGVLLFTTDLDEARPVADTLAVIYRGRIAGQLSPRASREEIGLLMGGQGLRDPPA